MTGKPTPHRHYDLSPNTGPALLADKICIVLFTLLLDCSLEPGAVFPPCFLGLDINHIDHNAIDGASERPPEKSLGRSRLGTCLSQHTGQARLRAQRQGCLPQAAKGAAARKRGSARGVGGRPGLSLPLVKDVGGEESVYKLAL